MSSSTNTPKAPKELSSELRMLLAFGLMGLILVGSNWIYHKFGLIPPDPATTSQTNQKTAAQKAAPLPGSEQGTLPGQTTTAANTNSPAPATNAEPVAPVAAANVQTWSVDTDVYHVVFSNQGAVVQSWTP